MDNQFYPILYNGYNYLSMYVLNLIHVSKRGPMGIDTIIGINLL